MALNIKTFRITENRLKKAAKKDFLMNEEGFLETDAKIDSAAFVLTKLDSGEKNNEWGRLVLDVDFPEDTSFVVQVLALDVDCFLRKGVETKYDDFILDEDEPFIKKMQLLELSKAKEFKNKKDILLTGIRGRFLWLSIKIEGNAKCIFRGAKIYNPGDLFLKLFPEIYQTDDDFFKRYLSIFSSVYADFDRKIESLTDFVDIDTAPVEVLPILAKWLGIEVDGDFLGEEKMRKLLKNAYYLSRLKGTRKAVVEIAKLILDEEPLIIEQSKIGQIGKENKKVYEELYSSNPFSFTVLVHQKSNEKLYAQLKFLIDQFKPARSETKIVFLGDAGNLDTYCYLGINAKLSDFTTAKLDEGMVLGQNITLE